MKKTMLIIGSAVIMLFLGLVYAWSIFVAPLESEFGWTRDQTSLTFTICMSFFCIGILATAQLRKILKVPVIILINAIIILIGFILTSRVQELWQLYVFYGVLCGFAVGCTYNCILSVVPLHFPKKVGFISGAMLFFYGIGGYILGTVATKLMGIYDWRMTFISLGIVFLVIFAIFCFFVRPPEATETTTTANTASDNSGYTPGQMLRHPYFYLFFIWQLFVNSLGLALIGHAASIAKEIGVPGAALASALGVLTVCTGLGKFGFGVIYDLKGRTFTMFLASFFGLIGAIFMFACIKSASIPMLIAGFVFAGLSFGAGPATNATFTRKQFGNKHFTINFGINTLSLLVGAFAGTYVVGLLRVNTGSYSLAAIVLICYMVLSVVLTALMVKKR